MRITIVVPCFNEQESIPLFLTEMHQLTFTVPVELEYIFIDDGSKDQTLAVIKKEIAHYPDSNIRYLSFSRNFGKEAALYAGLEKSTGEYVAVMDVDLQDPPALLPEMLTILLAEDYDCVGTRRVTRKGEPAIRSFFARQFYKIINRISETEIVDGARDYRLMNRMMVDSILELSEKNRFSKGIFSWVGYKVKYLEFENVQRSAGETSWSFWSLLKYSLDGIVGFSEVPLTFASATGFISFVGALIALIFIVLRALIYGDPTPGWPSLVCIIILFGGLQLLCIGIVGKYLGKVFIETKNRPIYLVKESNMNKEKE